MKSKWLIPIMIVLLLQTGVGIASDADSGKGDYTVENSQKSTKQTNYDVKPKQSEVNSEGQKSVPRALSNEVSTKDFKVDFAARFSYEMAEITARIVSAPHNQPEVFKVNFVYAVAQATAKMMPLIRLEQRPMFTYEMAKISTNLINAPNVEIESAKMRFAYEMAKLTNQVIQASDATHSKK